MSAANHIVLIAGMGTSPAVLTNAVWALAHQKKPVVPDEIVVFITKSGKGLLRGELFDGGIGSNLRGKLKMAGFADVESLVPQRGRAVMFPLSCIKWRNVSWFKCCNECLVAKTR